MYFNYATALALPWGNISGAGTLELNSAQAVNGTANWNPIATVGMSLPATFSGTVQLDNGRIQSPPTGLGSASNLVIKNGSQFLAFDGTVAGLTYTFPQNFTISGLGWGETGYNLGALRDSGMKVTFTGNITLAGSSAIYVQPASNANINVQGVISDDGTPASALTINAGDSYIQLSNANTYNGNTLINIATLKVGHDGAIPSGAGKGNVTLATTLDLNGFNPTVNGLSGAGTVTSNILGDSNLSIGANDQTSTFTGLIQNGSGTVGVTKVGSGTLTLTNTNTFTGPLSVKSGVLATSTINIANSNGPLGAGALPVTLGSTGSGTGALEYISTFSTSSDKPFTLATGGSGAFVIDNAQTTLQLTGTIDGSGNLVEVGPGTLVLGGANTYTGISVLLGGNLQVQSTETGTTGALGNGGIIAFTGGTLQYSPTNNFDYSSRFDTGNQTIRIDTAGQNVSFASPLLGAGGGNLILNDTTPSTVGQLLLNGTSVFPGNTTVAAGDLRGTGTLTNSKVVVTTGFGSVWPGMASFGSSVPAAGETLTVAGVDLSAGGKLKIALNTSSATSTQKLAVTGATCNITGSVLSLGIPNGATSGNSYTILTSTSPITGTFDSVFVNNALNIGSNIVAVTYTTNSIKVKITGSVTPVTIDSFTAQAKGAGVLLDWNCISEYQNAGFNLYRRSIGSPDWERINPALIAGRITNPDAKSYTTIDWAPSGVYEYRLESINVAGGREFFAADTSAVTTDSQALPTCIDAISNAVIEAVATDFLLASNSARANQFTRDFAARNNYAINASRTLSLTEAKVVSPNINSKNMASRNMLTNISDTAPKHTSVTAGVRWFAAGSVGGASNYLAAKAVYSDAGVLLIQQQDLPAGFDIDHVVLQREGRPVTALAQTPAGLVVYAPGYEDDYTNKDAIFLRATPSLTSAGVVAAASGLFNSMQPVNVTSSASVSVDYHDVYFDYNLRPYAFAPWFSAKYLTQGTAQDFIVTLPDVSSSPATVTVNVWSLTDSPAISPDHALQMVVNGQTVGQTQWDGGGKMIQLTFAVPHGILRSGENMVTLVTPTIEGQDTQIAFVHSFNFSYTRSLDGSNPLEITNDGNTACLFELDNVLASGVWVVDVRYPDRATLTPVELQAKADGTFRARFMANSGGSGKYLITPVGRENKTLAVSRRTVAPLRLNGTYLATGPMQFNSGVQPLLAKHGKEGIRGAFVDQEQLFDYYNFGRFGPNGIQKAVRAAQPKYLLLLGKTTFDYKNYSGLNVDPLCPAFLVSTNFWAQTTSDSQFGDLGRGYPEVAVGRLPVGSTSDLTGTVGHILSYKGLPTSGTRMHAIADRTDPEVADFAAQLDSMIRVNQTGHGMAGKLRRPFVLNAQ